MGLPDMLYSDHGADFTSARLERVCLDTHIQLIHSKPGVPQGRGKIERFYRTSTTELLPHLPGYIPHGRRGRPASPPELTLQQLDRILETFIVSEYNQRRHSSTNQAPVQRWSASGFIPRMPGHPEDLDLLLPTVATARKVQRDGIQFTSTRYVSPVLAAYVGEQVAVRYDPRGTSEKSVSTSTTPSYAGPSRRNWQQNPSAWTSYVMPEPTGNASSNTSCVSGAAWSTLCPLTRVTPSRRRTCFQLPLKPHPFPNLLNDTSCVFMKPINPGKRTLLDATDDGSRFLTYQLGQINSAAPPPPSDQPAFLATREHRRFTEFANTVRSHRYIGLCWGPAGVGKTLSARHYAAVNEWDAWQAALTEKVAPVPERILEARTAFYTPTVAATVRQIDQGLLNACQQISYAVDYAEHGVIDPFVHTESRSSGRTELLIIDEADRLKATGLEQVRDY